MLSGLMAPNSRQICAPHEPILNQPGSAFGGTSVPCQDESVGNLEVVPAGFTHRALNIGIPHLLNAIMRRSCIETTAERTMDRTASFLSIGFDIRLRNGRQLVLSSPRSAPRCSLDTAVVLNVREASSLATEVIVGVDGKMDVQIDVSTAGYGGRLEVLEGPTGRRVRSDAEKARITAESLPGAEVATVARKHGAIRWQVYD
ncbi:hypothetical protein ACVIM8_001668 [Bradyrhizobium sp. USDA 4529]